MALVSPYWYDSIKATSYVVIACIGIFAFLILLAIKTAIGIGLVLYSGNLHNIDLKLRVQSESANNDSKCFMSRESSVAEESLAEIERFTSIEGRIVG